VNASISPTTNANRRAVRRMWLTQTNEHGEALSQFDRQAPIERYCELFGIWPLQPASVPPAMIARSRRDIPSSHYIA
jgi:hypothetical protein